MKVITVLGTRPEIIRLSRLIPKMRDNFDHLLLHTGQNSNPNLSDQFFSELELGVPDIFLGIDTTSLASSFAGTVLGVEKVFAEHEPDAVLILGDTNSSVAAIIAERMQIPVYHMEAGNRAFDRNIPEELNRKMIDHISSFNLVYTEHARRNLINEGLHPRFIFKTGSPLPEVFEYFRPRILDSNILSELKLKEKRYFLASLHRQENVDDVTKLVRAMTALSDLAEAWDFPVVLTVHPRTEQRLDKLNRKFSSRIIYHRPFGYLDYCRLQISAKCVISDSGSIAEEAATMNFPSVSFRESIERPEALESSALILSGTQSSELLESVDYITRTWGDTPVPEDYRISDFSSRVVSVVLSTAYKSGDWLNINRDG